MFEKVLINVCWRKKQINKLMKNGSLIAYKFTMEQVIEMGGFEFLPGDLGYIQMWYEQWRVDFVLKRSCEFHIAIFVIVTDCINKKKSLLLMGPVTTEAGVDLGVGLLGSTMLESSAVEEGGCCIDALHVLNYLV